ncbi:MAG: SGNH/GDSL hydrolase family protein [Athalassotoga sp.]|uniref:SGNH/GDSL hydrolase family protein n=2 Tax=Athalassotoga sp. TaxID=2022597 RepID=UPI003D077AC4
MLRSGDIVLFQGDSITDYMRKREDPDDLGNGYPFFVSALWNIEHPGINVKFLNRGISGNRVRDLKSRWTKDCIDLKPTVVSILIGINDTWRRFDSNDPISVEDFERDYRFILDKVKEIGSKIVILEPYLIESVKSERTPNKEAWRIDLDPKIHVVRKLALEYKAIFIPLDGIMAGYCSSKDPLFWSYDGVHPTVNGSVLIAKKWIEYVERFEM